MVKANDSNFRLLGSSSDSDSSDDGEKVCTAIDGKSCCKDSVHEVTNDGTLYCSKLDIAVSANGKGIEKTYPDGDKNTVWWLNIDPCQLNSKNLCHFDHDDNDDTALSIQSDTAATTDDAVVTEPTASDGITPKDDADTTTSITVPEDEANEPTASDGIIPEDDADTTSITTVGSSDTTSITTVGSVAIVMVVTVAAVLAM